MTASGEPSTDIAIIGMACRLPGARTPRQYWELLSRGEPVVSPFPAARLRDGCRADDGTTCAAPQPLGGYIGAIDKFDASFFRMSEAEARSVDPQQRLLLELAWEACENAGVPPASLKGTNAGVFIGVSNHDFPILLWPRSRDMYLSTGLATSILANRIAHFLGLTGPSLAIDTACSSSLSAVHLACQSIRSGECSVAIVGSCSLLTLPSVTASLDNLGLISPTGRTRPFAEDADGYVRAEGAGTIVLKRHEDALRDGDRVLAVISGSAINHNGDSNGLTGPNRAAQLAVHEEACRKAGVDPADVHYVEASASGSKIGDALEAKTIVELYSRGRTARHGKLNVGTSKNVVGHLEGVSGIAAIVKVALAMEHEILPGCLSGAELSSMIRAEGTPIVFPDRSRTWSAGRSGRRIAGVSSFGFGGSNAHVVMKDPVPMPRLHSGPRFSVLPISARSRESLVGLLLAYAAPDGPVSSLGLDVLCRAAAIGRDHFELRCAFVADEAERLRAELIRTAHAISDGTLAVGGGPGSRTVWLALGSLCQVERELVARLSAEHADFASDLDEARRAADLRACDASLEAKGVVSDFVAEYCLARFLSSLLPPPSGYLASGFSGLVALVLMRALSLEDAIDVVLGRRELEAMQIEIPPPGSGGLLVSARGRSRCEAERRVSELLARRCVAMPKRRRSEARVIVRLGPPECSDVSGALADGETDRCCRLEPHGDLAGLLAELYVCGVDVDWRKYLPRSGEPYAALPNYPFERKRHWPTELLARDVVAANAVSLGSFDLAGAPIELPGSRERRFEYRIGPETRGAISRLDTTIGVVPLATQVAMALSHAPSADGETRVCLRSISVPAPLVVGCDGVIAQLVVLPADGDEGGSCRLVSRAAGSPGAEWRTTLSARLEIGERTSGVVRERALLQADFPAPTDEALERVRARLRGRGHALFLDEPWPLAAAHGECSFWARRPAGADRTSWIAGLVNASLSALLLSCEEADEGSLWLPVSIGSLAFERGNARGDAFAIVVRPTSKTAASFVADLTVLAPGALTVLEIAGASFTPVPERVLEATWGASVPCTETRRHESPDRPVGREGIGGYLRNAFDSLFGGAHGEDDLDAPLCSLGMDSLKAMELRIQLRRDFGFEISQVDMVGGLTGAELLSLVHEHVLETGNEGDGLRPPDDDIPTHVVDFSTAGTERVVQIEL